jgi:hypothetical protein
VVQLRPTSRCLNQRTGMTPHREPAPVEVSFCMLLSSDAGEVSETPEASNSWSLTPGGRVKMVRAGATGVDTSLGTFIWSPPKPVYHLVVQELVKHIEGVQE